jgi:hypothetical protein
MDALVTLLIIAAISWAIFVQIGARRQVNVEVSGSEQEAAEQVRSYFGRMWTQVSGRGHLNYRPKLRAHAPTLSVDFAPNGTASCTVSIWTSAWTSKFGAMYHAQLAWRRKRGLAARLTGASASGSWTRGA